MAIQTVNVTVPRANPKCRRPRREGFRGIMTGRNLAADLIENAGQDEVRNVSVPVGAEEIPNSGCIAFRNVDLCLLAAAGK